MDVISVLPCKALSSGFFNHSTLIIHFFALSHILYIDFFELQEEEKRPKLCVRK